MSTIESIASEFEREAKTTRRHFERLPDDKFDWRPHEKSFTLSALAGHIIDCMRWADPIFTKDELDLNPATYKPFRANSLSEMLAGFDNEVLACTQLLSGVDDSKVAESWRLKVMGRTIVDKPREAVFKDFILHHIIHHRGQLSVYLRLLDIPVPGSYGPSADEL